MEPGLRALAVLKQIQIWCPPVPVGCVGRGLNTGTMAAIALKSPNSVSPVVFSDVFLAAVPSLEFRVSICE